MHALTSFLIKYKPDSICWYFNHWSGCVHFWDIIRRKVNSLNCVISWTLSIYNYKLIIHLGYTINKIQYLWNIISTKLNIYNYLHNKFLTMHACTSDNIVYKLYSNYDSRHLLMLSLVIFLLVVPFGLPSSVFINNKATSSAVPRTRSPTVLFTTTSYNCIYHYI